MMNDGKLMNDDKLMYFIREVNGKFYLTAYFNGQQMHGAAYAAKKDAQSALKALKALPKAELLRRSAAKRADFLARHVKV